MGIAAPRIILSLVVLGTLFPFTAVLSLFWSLAMTAAAFGMMFHGKVLPGLVLLVWSVCASYGLITVAELLIHYWRSPWRNPQMPMLRRSVIGLVMGWLSIPLLIFIPTGSSFVSGYAIQMAILVMPVSLAVTLLFVFNHRRARRAANHAIEADTPGAAQG